MGGILPHSVELFKRIKIIIMKTRIISLLALVCLAGTLSAQTVNWRSWNNTDRHVAGVYAGWDYATTA